MDSRTATTAPARWQATSSPILWRHWDDLYVLYHVESGDTHVLDAMGHVVLRALERGPAITDDVLQRVADDLARQPDAELAAQVQQLLAELANLDLIDPVQS